ncbi:MAG: alpha-L-arabinofuranosidase C-terminal domain-containing protein [Pseudomonadota bacterium]
MMSFYASITLDPSTRLGSVHDHLYGANLEHIGRSVYEGHWAEMLRNRKFLGHDRAYVGLSEGLSHQHDSFGIAQPWTALNPDNERVLFVHDNTSFYTGRQSQRITILKPDGGLHGVQQSGLHLVQGARYRLRVVLKGCGQEASITLGDQSWFISEISPDWQTHETEVTVEQTQGDGVFAIAHSTAGDLWVGCASVMPAENSDGHRPDVVAAIAEWGPTFLRWPGGNFASAYHWEMGIGDRDKRPGYLDPAWNLWEPNDVGTDEFIDLCRLLNTEPILTINMGNGTPEEAARWVEYCNGGPDTEMGKLRAANGYEAPFDVKTWFVGNEQFGNWQVGHCDAETYARLYCEYAAAMRAVDPSLNLIGVGVPTDLYGRWNELVLKGTHGRMDELSVHYYSIRTEKWDQPPPAEELYWPKVAAAQEVADMLDETWRIMCEHGDPPPPIAFDEWNTYVGGKPPDFFEDYGIADALYVGALMNACLMRADWIKMSAIFNLINVMGNYRVTPDGVWKTPSTLVLEIFTKFRGDQAIGCAVQAPTVATPSAGNLPPYDALPLVDAAATMDESGQTLFLSIVNRDPERRATIELRGITRAETARVHRITGDTPQSLNTENDPQEVVIETEELPADAPALDLPPHTVAMVVVTLEGTDRG